ncbi:amino acid adenylation domain-containing protein [Embleya sp. NPDC020630]|uniref:amino acid adenylation domain-containing protein n=1 Tax=Embleya sp. NPDC020630 TaxID=3363979 RepID=UPI0037A8AC23
MVTSHQPPCPAHARIRNRPRTDYPRDVGIPALFAEQVSARPDSPAVEWVDGGWSYGELGERVRRGATGLRARGVTNADHVAVLIGRSADAVAATLAILYAGAVYLPIDPSYPADRIAQILSDADVRTAVSAPGARIEVPDGLDVVGVDELFAAPDRADEQWWRGRGAGEAAYVIYTSGSTGAPKGVVCPHRGQTRLARDTGDLRVLPEDRWLATTNPTFDVSCLEMFATLLNGACLVVARDEDLLDSKALESVLRDARISVTWLSAGLFHQHAHVAPKMFAGLRCLIVGGDTVGPRAVRAVLRHGRPGMLLNGYGPTENSSLSTTHRVDELSERAENVPIGVNVAGSTSYVVRDDRTIADPGRTGELWVGGDGVALGYLNDPEKTAERFVEDPWTPPEVRSRLYRTGDMARWREDGALEYLGRRDRQVKLRGYRVELDEVEAVLSAHARVRQAAVGIVGEGAGEVLVAAVVAHSDRERRRLVQRLHEHVRDRLPTYMVPNRITVVDRLPLTNSGKIDRGKLAELSAPASTPGTGDEEPCGEWEQGVARVWRDVLNADVVTRDDTFVALGGTSLRATQITAALRERLHIDAGYGRAMIRALVGDPSLADFAAAVHALHEGRAHDHTPVDFAAEARLAPELRFDAPASTRARNPRQVFLTGATGFLGVHLVEQLLGAGVNRVHCLIRADDAHEALDRLAARMRRHGVDPEPLTDRVVPVPGELAEPRFGLPDETWNGLAREIDLIVHCGSRVNFAYPYAALAPINVGGTRTVLELAGEHILKPVHHISSMAVIAGFGTAGIEHVEEDTPLDHANRISLGYPETKWVAEKLIVEAGRRGLPVAIHRPYEITPAIAACGTPTR